MWMRALECGGPPCPATGLVTYMLNTQKVRTPSCNTYRTRHTSSYTRYLTRHTRNSSCSSSALVPGSRPQSKSSISRAVGRAGCPPYCQLVIGSGQQYRHRQRCRERDRVWTGTGWGGEWRGMRPRGSMEAKRWPSERKARMSRSHPTAMRVAIGITVTNRCRKTRFVSVWQKFNPNPALVEVCTS